MDKTLLQLSERMLTGVATIYGRNSMEYSKAGGSSRKRSKKSISQVPLVVALPATQSTQTATNGKGILSDV